MNDLIVEEVIRSQEENGIQRGWLQSKDNQEIYESLEQKLPKVLGIFDKIVEYDITMKVRFHGKADSGKTSIIRSLCRFDFHFDTPGLSRTSSLFPVMFDDVKWLMLDMYTTGELAEDRFNYLAFDHNEKFNFHIVVFSMTDYSSFVIAKEIVKTLGKQRVLLVGTKLDLVSKHQVSTLELEDFVDDTNRTLILVNCKIPMIAEGGCYSIIEELCDA